MCIPIHSTSLLRDDRDVSLAFDRGPSVQPVEPPSADPAVTGDERRPIAETTAEEMLCNA
jgi:hypothetical protein